MADPPALTPRQAWELVEHLRSLPGGPDDVAEIRLGLPLVGRDLAVALVREALDAAGYRQVCLTVAPPASWPRLLAVERLRRR